MDKTSRYPEVVPLRSTSSKLVTRGFMKWTRHFSNHFKFLGDFREVSPNCCTKKTGDTASETDMMYQGDCVESVRETGVTQPPHAELLQGMETCNKTLQERHIEIYEMEGRNKLTEVEIDKPIPVTWAIQRIANHNCC
ncbi:hypothetical protein E2C01_032480 [Portunus trituberculatus]|uniref:Uncharacterized protein n=1 Tax=Portunus trituberculatus TaxID=210409 RepID=A0A5B7EW40_PORTR|nr:hypothetical protein [Portunus trituberculatus]